MQALSQEEIEAKRKEFEEHPEMFFDCRKVMLVIDKKEVEPGKEMFMVINNCVSVRDTMLVKGHADESLDAVRDQVRFEQQKKREQNKIVIAKGGVQPFRNLLRKK